LFLFYYKDFIYLFERKRPAREGIQAGGGGEGEAGSWWSREPRCGARSQDPGIMT